MRRLTSLQERRHGQEVPEKEFLIVAGDAGAHVVHDQAKDAYVLTFDDKDTAEDFKKEHLPDSVKVWRDQSGDADRFVLEVDRQTAREAFTPEPDDYATEAATSDEPIGSGKNGYVAFYKGKRYEVYGDTILGARNALAQALKIPPKKHHEINITLAQKDGVDVVHTPTEARMREAVVADLVDTEIVLGKAVDGFAVDSDTRVSVPSGYYQVLALDGTDYELQSSDTGKKYWVSQDQQDHFKPVTEGRMVNLRAANEQLASLHRTMMERAEAPAGKKADLIWDESDIWQAEVEYLMAEPFENDWFFSKDYDLGKIRDDSKSNEEFLEKVEAAGLMNSLKKMADKAAGEDSDIYENEWENLTDAITDWMKEQGTDRWVGGVTGFGWRKTSGGKQFRAKDGKELLQNVLPKTQNRFEVYLDKDEIRIENWHHDAPMGGEWYTIRPATEADEE